MSTIVDLKMEDGSIRQFETKLFSFDNTGYCLLTSVEKGKYPEAFVMKTFREKDLIRLKGIEDEEEHKRAYNYIQIHMKLDNPENINETELYYLLTSGKLPESDYKTSDLNEGMAVVNESIDGWWKQRFLLNHNTKQAWEFIAKNLTLQTITHEDIDWDEVGKLPLDAIEQAKYLSAYYPTFIRQYKNGVAQVSWQLNPDGMYYMDEDGYGMTDDQEITVYGLIDQQCKVVKKFR